MKAQWALVCCFTLMSLTLAACGSNGPKRPEVFVKTLSGVEYPEGPPGTLAEGQANFTFRNPNNFEIVEEGESNWPGLRTKAVAGAAQQPLRKFSVGPGETTTVQVPYRFGPDPTYTYGSDPKWTIPAGARLAGGALRVFGYFVFQTPEGLVCVKAPGTISHEMERMAGAPAACGVDWGLESPEVLVESLSVEYPQGQATFRFKNPNKYEIVEEGNSPWPEIRSRVTSGGGQPQRKFSVGPRETKSIQVTYRFGYEVNWPIPPGTRLTDADLRMVGFFMFQTPKGPICVVMPGTPAAEIAGAPGECRYWLTEAR